MAERAGMLAVTGLSLAALVGKVAWDARTKKGEDERKRQGEEERKRKEEGKRKKAEADEHTPIHDPRGALFPFHSLPPFLHTPLHMPPLHTWY
jgi:hypothetical protein